MTRHVQGRDGKMKGSIGDGKNRVPTPGITMSVADDAPATQLNVDDAARLYHERMRELAVATDTELAELDSKQFSQTQHLVITRDNIHRTLGHRQEYVRIGRKHVSMYTQSLDDTLAEAQAAVVSPDTKPYAVKELTRLLAEHDERVQSLRETKNRIRELNAIYDQHRWTRAFVVPAGHVHSSMDCSTCNKNGQSTKFVWLPQYSGSEETQIVEDAGERACTVCYPTAPIDVLSRPTRIYSDDERREIEEAEQRRSQREANRAARAAKAPTASGESIVLEVSTFTARDGSTRARVEELKTERTAMQFAADIAAAQQSGRSYLAPYTVDADRYEVVKNAIVTAVAEKRGVDPSEVLAEVDAKAQRKIRQYETG